jgi:hypothetical protein
MQLEISRREFKKRISALVNELHGSGFNAFFFRFQVLRRPFVKTAGKLSPAGLYSGLLWLKPNDLSELDFCITLLRHMGEGAKALSYLGELHYIEQKRHAEMKSQLMGAFQSVRLTKPTEAAVQLFSKSRVYSIR